MEHLLSGFVGLAGVAIGALVQFILDRRSIRDTRSLEMKSQAYADYLEGAAMVCFGQSEGRVRLAAAKSRITAFGDAVVVNALHDFETSSQSLSDPAAQARFLHLVTTIRSHSIADSSVDELKLKDILFGLANRSSKQ